ncbi:DNA polymerase III subunit chi [Alteromonas halophila]|uniref:DNA polymerase III subunit chi n=1 Tax=Alteromonas halophila TaxID=516698 RepID=A0A918N1B8_9ALTE|nr:DNA polymerase III subunit chi [Alteromonas halophila]GGW93089.1 DNA polymerase III subunit chi [Alteromonas halophila]
MPNVVFYQLSEQERSATVRAASLIAEAYTNKQKVAVLCDNQQQAEEIDDLLWQLPSDRFVPHNMHGEGPPSGTPVEICWQPSQVGRRPVVVSLSQELVMSPQHHQHIIDFVPLEDDAKQQARVRYKKYQQAGCAMQFKSA